MGIGKVPLQDFVTTTDFLNSEWKFHNDMKVYDLRKVAPSNLGTKEMWKDAIIRMKVYVSNLFEGHLMNMARNQIGRASCRERV